MAPLSILPGRVRYEDKRLCGNKQRSRHLEATITAIPSVLLISSSHRTGRILVEFDEGRITRDDLVARIRETLACEVPATEGSETHPTAPDTPTKMLSIFSGGMLADVVLHLLLPAPFDLLLPAIGPTFRREAFSQ